ncbi:MAG: adenylate/guanylate cyclase domain-containing protein [Victivallaceae bacterium]|nr:adenylate/guanylate cyclase domain-containing protein [Victivallaceae bacterium]
MIWFVLFMVAVPLAALMAALLFVQYRRFTGVIGELERKLEAERNDFGVRTTSFRIENEQLQTEREKMQREKERLTEQKFAMAEANLTMLELKEKLTEQTAELKKQKFAMAEANLKMLELNENLAAEKEKSAKLLRNILPERVIAELGENGRSEPELFEHVTVFFSDIVGFTAISGALDPALLISELSDIFTEFDHIFVRNGCERIKTIGDAYLSVSGMPSPDAGHFCNILRSALEAIKYLAERNRTHDLKWQMRMGINSGKVVGGIVGVEKYIYDVFGDTINTAARMEQTSEPMRINVAESTYSLAKDEFEFIPREPAAVKGKGVMRMYWLTGERQRQA